MDGEKKLPAMDLQKSKNTLVLDLRETLVVISRNPLPHTDLTVEFKFQGHLEKFHVTKRPGVDQLLQQLSAIYEIVVFTEEGKSFTDALLKHLDPTETIIPMTHRLYFESCEVKHPVPIYIKDLAILGRDLSRVIFVDDKPYHSYQCENAFPLGAFKGDKNDRNLFQLIDFCKSFAASSSLYVREAIACYPLSVCDNFLLPAVSEKKLTLVLELYGALVDICPEPKNGSFRVEYGFEGKMRTCFVSKRPGLDKLLDELRGFYEIVVFTRAERANASALLDKLDPAQKIIPLSHRIFRNSCTELRGNLVKDLCKLGRDLGRVIYVDVWPCESLQPENLRSVGRFSRHMKDRDRALFDLMDFCKSVAESEPCDVRTHLAADIDNNDRKRDKNVPMLPPMENHKERTLVLSLSGTFIQSSPMPLPGYDFTVDFESLGERHTCYVLKRPGLELLLSKLPVLGYEIVVFSSAEKEFVDCVLQKLDPQQKTIAMTHRFSRKDCTELQNSVIIKDLSKLGRDLSKVIFVDDRPYYSYQSENAFPVCEFKGDMNDRALFDLIAFCKRVAKYKSSDVREDILCYALMSSSINAERSMLPPMRKTDIKMNKKTLVLDLDETLVHSTDKLPKNKKYDFAVEIIEYTNTKCTYYILKRPWVDLMLNELKRLYEIVVFTAADREYADAILDKLDPSGSIFRHRLYRDSCTELPGPRHVKDLSELGRNLSKVIFVDDNYLRHHQQENAFPVLKFANDMSDRELLGLVEFCKRVANSKSDVRSDLLSYALSQQHGYAGWN
ncbi:hypothetical protein KI387_027330 [Taxus chinensis]|uniref:protein-serine/threonine phosphatase n=1 Tax=Taxus chinensis TaxID=29808 RepID=A0AA38FXY3_TAXCH|nr:hypothetical protein KI387_027330 [Taxus chinensis]